MNDDTDASPGLTLAQAAALLDLPPSLVARFVTSGILAASELRPGEIHISLLALARFLSAHPWLAAGTTGQAVQ